MHQGDGEVRLFVQNASAHQVERGRGAFQHESFEIGAAELRFSTGGLDDGGILKEIEQWVKVFDSQDQAVEFGNTASGVRVRQIKAGMSFAEVEAAMGPPQTRVDLSDKVLYKYKDMTVEFRDGKVADVR